MEYTEQTQSEILDTAAQQVGQLVGVISPQAWLFIIPVLVILIWGDKLESQ